MNVRFFLKVLEHKTSAKSIYAQVAEARQGLQPMQSRRGNTVGDPRHPSSHSWENLLERFS